MEKVLVQKDAVGHKLKVGDIVVKTFNGSYAQITFGRVKKINPKTVTITLVTYENGIFTEHKYPQTTVAESKSILRVNEVFGII